MLPQEPELRVLVVADDHLTRAGLVALLAAQTGATLVGQVAGDTGLSSVLDVYRPDVVVWDMGWDPTLAFEHLAELEVVHPPVIALLTGELRERAIDARTFVEQQFIQIRAETIDGGLRALKEAGGQIEGV